MNDTKLHQQGVNRLGNVLVPNDSYGTIIEQKMQTLLQNLWDEGVKELSARELCREIGKRCCNDTSILYWAAKNNIPVYVLNFGQGEGRWDLGSLESLARNTGGAYYDVYRSNAFPYLYQTIQSYRSPAYLIYFEDVYAPELKNKFLEAEVEVDYNGRVGRGMLGFVYP